MPDSSTDTADIESDTIETDVNAEESSTPEKVQGVSSYEQAVDAALKVEEAPPASDEQDSKEPDPDKPEEVKPADPELSEEELAKYSKGAQRRIRELVEERKTVQAEVEPLRQEIETIKPKAERLDQLTGYMREHEITPDHLNNALGLTAMINKGNYREALPVLENLLNQVKTAAGEVLPKDLQSQVDLGYITEAHAKELNRAKVSEKQATERAQKVATDAETQRQQREVQTIVNTATSAAEAWNSEQVKSDPDWNQKRDLVTEGMELELRRLGPAGYPRTDKAVRDLLDKVKSSVETRIGKFRSAPKAMTPVNGNPVSPRSAAKPASYLDAVEIGLANANSG